ncbi:ATP-grasp domain-containing protein [Streptomyces sp. NBC_01433]|uniref:ATP-grasp domain-containing protein n=1 Tax=Streptomyces sp. NBC_01433 TaxID=2903864 RepID=UPI002259FB20|nr:ATP-grasp domain-containing protein [Streptomyces sp. NBC_01433]MCX4682123.1 ATP-grasp domain-containing protein [Streptomyces sp. NBC_01433]
MPHASHSPKSPLLVVLGAGSRTYRGYGLQHIAARYPVALLDEAPPAWAEEHVALSRAVDLTDGQAVREAVEMLAAERGVAGVLTYIENHVVLAARVAGHFGLPGTTPASVDACRDKYLSRSLLAAAGVPSARSYLVADVDTAVEYAQLLGGPVVLKPRSLAGSAGVQRADTPEQVRAAFQTARGAGLFGLERASTSGVLIEEYLEGPEVSVECVVLGHGTMHIAAITRKYLSDEPFFQETGHLVDGADPLLADPQIRAVAQAALEAVGISSGVMHVEMRLTREGPRIIELNARLGGDLIPHLVLLATGLNLPQITADLAVGADPELVPSHSQSAAVRFLFADISGHVTAVNTGVFAPWLDRFEWTAAPGSHVTAPPHATLHDRTALAVVTGAGPDICHQRLHLVEQRSGIHIQPDTTTNACVA